jgi:lysophospholipase L1-like esterase
VIVVLKLQEKSIRGKMKIVCIGDSLTYGFGVRRTKTWTYMSEKKLGMEIINEGINGDTTGGMLGRFYSSVFSQRPDCVFIMGGTNDFIAGADMGTVKANIMSMVHQSMGKMVEPIIGIPPNVDLKNIREDWAEFTDFDKIAKNLEEYKEWLIKFSRLFNLKIIDFSFDDMDYEKFKYIAVENSVTILRHMIGNM